jgi:DNA-binding PadR family transcriptional regulator
MDPEPFTHADEQDEQCGHERPQYGRGPHGHGHHEHGPHAHRGHGYGPHGGRMALPLAALGLAGLARAGKGRKGGGHGPHFGRAALPLMALGIAGMAMSGGDHGRGGFRGGPFGEGRGPFGGNPFGGNPFGGRGPFGGFPFGGPGGPFGGGGPRAKRGDIRTGILALLNEEPRNGYQIIQELGQRSGGAWRPSSGAVYPALQQMEDEGLIVAEERDGKRAFTLTEAGRLAYAATNPDESGAPWEALQEALRGGIGEEWRTVGGLVQEVAMAAMQVVRTGNAAQITQAATQLKNTRRALYRILAEDAPTDPGDTPDGAGRA